MNAPNIGVTVASSVAAGSLTVLFPEHILLIWTIQFILIFLGALGGGVWSLWLQPEMNRRSGVRFVIHSMIPALILSGAIADYVSKHYGMNVRDAFCIPAFFIAAFHRRVMDIASKRLFSRLENNG